MKFVLPLQTASEREHLLRMKENYEKRLAEQVRTGKEDMAAPCINLRGLLRHQTDATESQISDAIVAIILNA